LAQRLLRREAGTSDYPGSSLEKNMKELELFCKKVDNLEVPLMEVVEKVLGSGQ